MTINDVLADAKEKMDLAVEVAKDDFATVSAGRANPALFQKVLVEYYGTPTPLVQLATLQNQDARTILITPFDKSALKDIEKALVAASHLGATVGNDGNVIRATLPELTEDRRKAKDDLDATKDVGEDEIARAEKELESLTKTTIDSIDEALKRKEAELLEV